MTQTYGTIRDGDEVLATDVPVQLWESDGGERGLKSWGGTVKLTASMIAKTLPATGPRATWTLELADGRSGQIILGQYHVDSSGGADVEFQGSHELT